MRCFEDVEAAHGFVAVFGEQLLGVRQGAEVSEEVDGFQDHSLGGFFVADDAYECSSLPGICLYERVDQHQGAFAVWDVAADALFAET